MEMDLETLIPGLPKDVSIAIIARVPRYWHAHLSLVSKSWRTLLRSALFLQQRRAHNLQQEFLLMMFKSPGTPSYSWFLLQEDGEEPLQQQKQQPSHRRCVKLPLMPPPQQQQKNYNHQSENENESERDHHPLGAACVCSDSKLFVMGGSVNDIPCSHVWVYDACVNCWFSAPNMTARREFGAAGVIDGKIFVAGGCLPTYFRNSASWAEVYDPHTQTWSSISSPPELQNGLMHGSAVLGGKLIAMADRGGVVYDPANDSWDRVPARLDNGWRGRVAVVDGILYSYDYLKQIRGYDPHENRWIEVEGLQNHFPKFLSGAALANVGGKLYVVWEQRSINSNATEIMCAALNICKDSQGSLTGTILWSERVLLHSQSAISKSHLIHINIHEANIRVRQMPSVAYQSIIKFLKSHLNF